MEKSTLNHGFDLEALIREKDFHELGLEERAEVLSEVSEREYQQMRELVLWSGELLKETKPMLMPRNETRLKLTQRFQEKNKERKIVRLLRTPVPAWQVAAAMVMLVASIQIFRPTGWLSDPASQQFGALADSTTKDTASKMGHHVKGDSLSSVFKDSIFN